MYDTLLKKITPHTLVLTPSQALRDQLVEVLPAGAYSIFALHTYLLKLFEECQSPKILLSEFQEWQLWQKIIGDSKIGKTLLNIPSTAKLVQEAFTLSAEWHLPLLSESVFLTDETHQFIKWSTLFQTYCEDQKWLSRALLAPEFGVYRLNLKRPKKIFLVNFDKLNPQTQHFFDTLETPYSFINIDKKASVECRRFPDFETELEAMACWAKHLQNANPRQAIHCVVPELYKHQSKVERLFRKVFNTPLPQGLPLELHNSTPLSRFPLIKIALLILALERHKNPIEHLTEILLTPFMGESLLEASGRANMDMILRKLNVPHLKWKDVLFYAQKEIPLWAHYFSEYLILKTGNVHIEAPFSHWGAYFQDLLTSVGWPGERPLNEKERAIQRAFEKGLAQLMALDPQTNTTYSEKKALILLQQFLHHSALKSSPPSDEVATPPLETNFKTPTSSVEKISIKPKNTIQILDLKDAAQLSCEARWICGLHHEVWPASPRPNPFLPPHLQSEKDLPHSSYQNELSFAKQLTERLTQAATQVIFSFPENNQDGALKMSPLLKEWKSEALPLVARCINDVETQHKNPPHLPQPSLDCVPLLAMTEVSNTLTQGGSGILKSQSACPFQAFAKYRLKAKAPEVPSTMLNALDRGQLLHGALEHFWGQVHTQATLLSYNENQLTALISHSVQQALLSKKQMLLKCPEHWLVVEKHCLISLLAAWCEVERQRPSFRVIARETKQTISLGNLNLNLTIDRIDQLANSDTIVIDYKTGQTKISKNDWWGDRPREPQLPLYCLALPEVRGSLIAQLRAQKPGFVGVTAHPSGIAGVEESSWEETVTAWSQTLHKLAEEFSRGYAAVSPREKSVCDTCEFPSLCRINEKPV